MHAVACAALLFLLDLDHPAAQQPAPTLAAVFAHPDDEISLSPILARYAREGARVYLISATDGSQGHRTLHTSTTGTDLFR